MKVLGKRFLSLLLTMILLFSLIPIGTISTSAAGGVKEKLDSIIKTYPNGSRWTSSFDGGIQCYGFGKLVIYNIFGKSTVSGYTYRTWKYDGSSSSGMSVIGSITSYSSTNVKNLLSKAKPGDVLQFNTTKQHTMIVYEVASDGVWIYDCNWDNNCGISLRKSSFGAWSGRNSSKLTLLRSDNYASIDGEVTHKINTSYSKNFIAYPKAKITATNIFDANHTQISSTAWIGTSDKCTIAEVYTDGCCKVTYPLDSGGTETVYSKISLFTLPTLSIKYDANGGAISDTSKYYLNSSGLVYQSSSSTVFNQKMVDGTTYDDGLYNYTTFGISRTGYTFKGWGTTSSGGTVYSQSEAMTAKKLYSSISKGNATITLYAIWKPNTLSVYYNANGASISSDTYKLSNNLIYNKSDSSKFVQTWTYNTKKSNGLTNCGTFGLSKTGHHFKGWGTSSSGGTIFDHNNIDLLPETINNKLKSGNCSSTLYAIWEPNTLNIYYKANGGTITSDTYILSNDYVYTKSNSTKLADAWTYNSTKTNGLYNAKTFGLARDGYKFVGWSAKADGTGTIFNQDNTTIEPTDITATIKTSNCTLDLYAIWEKDATEPPTEKPTEAPTEKQTEAETVIPTQINTEPPTIVETLTPTEVPTIEVTEENTEIETVIPTEAEFTIGDVDLDGNITIMDATLIQRAIAKAVSLTDKQSLVADTDRDSKISVMDATSIQRYIAKIITSF